MTKLIIVEGLSGSGKSTTAKAIYNAILGRGIAAELFIEGDYNHPADFDGVSFFNEDEFDKLQRKYISYAEQLNKLKIAKYDGFLIPYRKAIEELQVVFADDIWQEIAKRDIYELPLDVHSELIRNRWKEFVDNCINADRVVIFECCFIQNPVTITMIKEGARKTETINYINRLAELIKPLNPILVYIEQDSIEKSFMKAVEERPKEWLEGFQSYYTNQGYGLLNGLHGLDGILEILNVRRGLEREIINQLDIDKHVIDNTLFMQNELEQKIDLIIERYF